MPGTFVALMVFHFVDGGRIGVALIAGALSVSLLILSIDQWKVTIATVIGASIRALGEEWINEPSS